MNNKGFTLIELLAVIVVIAIVGGIATLGFNVLFSNSNEKALQAKKDLILETAMMYGEDNELLIDTSCEISGNYADCLVITLQNLIDSDYYTSYEKCKNDNLTKCVYNDVTKKIMNNDEIIIYEDSRGINAVFKKDTNFKINQ